MAGRDGPFYRRFFSLGSDSSFPILLAEATHRGASGTFIQVITFH
jgi:hypothetical protein